MGVYPILFAAGAVEIERLAEHRGLRWLRWTLPVLPIVTGAIAAPLVLPILSPEATARYASLLDPPERRREIQREVGSATIPLPLAHPPPGGSVPPSRFPTRVGSAGHADWRQPPTPNGPKLSARGPRCAAVLGDRAAARVLLEASTESERVASCLRLFHWSGGGAPFSTR